MNEETMFIYAINPKKPIRTISRIGYIRVPRSLELTKEEVKICLKHGSVYRHFKNTMYVPVNGANLDRLHNEEFMTEAEYEKFLNKSIIAEDEPVIAEDKKETVEPTIDEIVVEQASEPISITDEATEVKEPEVTETVVEEVIIAKEEPEEINDDSEVVEEIASESTESVKEEVVENNTTESAVEEVVETKQEAKPAYVASKTVVNYNNNKKKK